MTFRDKLESIMERFGLDNEHMREITHSTKNRISKLLTEDIEPTDAELKHLCETFNIKPKVMLSPYPLPMLTMRKEIDMSKYKSIIDAYVEVLKEYYNEPWEVYVLARLPYKNTFKTFLGTLFSTSDLDMDKDREPFTPNYLAINGEAMLIVNIKEGILEVTEVDEVAKETRFIFKKYKYVRANKVQLKPEIPAVEQYFKNF